MSALGEFAIWDTSGASQTLTTTTLNSRIVVVAAVSQVGPGRGVLLNR
jgi:hypothetical protein